MKKNTREKLLQQAELLFAKNGFYGTSINDVATTLSVSKQAVLHHFPSKEKLYAAVLARAAQQLQDFVASIRDKMSEPRGQLRAVILEMSNTDTPLMQVVILLIRELLDNRERAESAQQWFLRPFLDALTDIVEEGKKRGHFGDKHSLAFVYQLLGAAQYYLVSQPTLERLYDEAERTLHQQQHIRLLEAMLD